MAAHRAISVRGIFQVRVIGIDYGLNIHAIVMKVKIKWKTTAVLFLNSGFRSFVTNIKKSQPHLPKIML
jgi:hypothetical protein